MSIGELAARFGLATHVLRHWEAMGLIRPARRSSGRRRYTEDQVSRVTMIVRGKAAGLGLEQLREMFDAGTRDDRRELLRRHQAELEWRIRQAEASRTLIGHALECSEPDFTLCPKFQQMCAGSLPEKLTPDMANARPGRPGVRDGAQRRPMTLTQSVPSDGPSHLAPSKTARHVPDVRASTLVPK
ncbi:DNA-binding transcriptional regulator, MerR family [Nonomuraea solani]|uniref:DNA-binding transcriptional regulator, MerR family n=2 Tax=Nonomuraea solani TaxID=1144553 RepID=A0A1H6EV08_9ACTN|nr:DNA-binding transcriptional regulator, MerR family [Nonomuraea solani]